ncbi:hypothetical protein LEP1GSC036_4389 [Leptospira weilii str. 2006001853]|uniref:Uncharacterized protein n=1 Tax=Leptospira weilii str. 2006001853 TaxID=1001589 RepID=A0A828Z0H9_9LEPT|nr:hypothetical protein [Leptospira weilii]EKR63524.1 hypothetical protein LEP1GSC036_4389 [Leptospira weilii str. 2006001853]OMI17802.1 hypothetical protein BUQ74_08415 [Leptospira weilii serovar Heyan]
MVFRCFQILIQIAYPASYSKRMKVVLQIHLEDSYREGSFQIFHLFDILISGLQERIFNELRSFRLLWKYDHRSAFGLTILIPWNLFLIMIFASLFVRGPGWLKFFHDFPYKKNDSMEFLFLFLLFLAGILLVQDLFLFKKKRSVFKRYSYMFYINMSLIVPFFLILIL